MKRKILAGALALTLLGGGALTLSGCKNDTTQEQTITNEQAYTLFVNSYTSLVQNVDGIANSLKSTLVATTSTTDGDIDPSSNTNYVIYNYKNDSQENVELRLYKDMEGNITGQEALCVYEEGNEPSTYYVYHSSLSDDSVSINKEPYTNSFMTDSIISSMDYEILNCEFTNENLTTFTLDKNKNMNLVLETTLNTYDSELQKNVTSTINFEAKLDSTGRLLGYHKIIEQTTDDGEVLPTIEMTITLEYGLSDETIDFINTYTYLMKGVADNQ